MAERGTRLSSFSRWVAAAPILLAFATHSLAREISLGLPLACEPGRTCFVQHHVDHDAGPDARDYACGSRTYDKHNGTDLRVPSKLDAAGPPGVVLAVAPGRVLRARADIADVSVRETGLGAVAGRECGNGLVIDHGKGWESQYCHLAKGSLRVSPGDPVVSGQPIGQIGMSGASEFPHLHLTIRHQGKVVDPFAASLKAGDCDPLATKGRADNLWEPSVRTALAYRAGTILNTGFTAGPVDMAMIENGEVTAVDRDAPALVAYVRSIGLQAGDVLALTLIGPDGAVLAERREAPLVRARAQSLIFAGRRRPADGWAPGAYRATFTIKRGDAIAGQTEIAIEPTNAGR